MTDTLQHSVVSEDRAPEILAAAEIVIERLGHDKLSLGHIARVSLIPLARIYQYFADRNAVLGALSARAFARFAGSVDTRGNWAPELSEAQRIARVVDRFASFVADPSAAYLVLCAPFDTVSEETRQEAVRRLAAALGSALIAAPARPVAEALETPGYRSDEALEYAAELVFACFRRSYLVDGRVTSAAIEMAHHAVQSFVAASAG